MPELPRPRPLFLALGVVALAISSTANLPAGPVLIPVFYGCALLTLLLALGFWQGLFWQGLFWQGLRGRMVLFALPLFLLAGGRTAQTLYPAPDDVAHWQGRPSVWVRGTVVSDTEEKAHGSIGMTLAAQELNDYERTYPVSGLIRVTLRAVPPEVRPAPGMVVQVRGRVTKPPPATNPGGFDYQAYLRRRGIFSTLTVKNAGDVRPGSGKAISPWQRVVLFIRQTVVSATTKHLKPDDAALMNGILLSVRARLSIAVVDAFSRTGAIHILSVSGLHLTTLALFLGWIFGLFTTPRPVAALVTIVLLWLFVLAAGGTPPAVRSAIMATVFLLAPLLRRRAEPLHALATAGVGILLVQPGALYDPGFQLSFVTTATILLWGQPLFLLWLPWEPGQPLWMRAVNFILGGLLVGLIAEVGSGPLVAYHFNRVTLIGIVANVPLSLLTNSLLIGGLAASCLSCLPDLVVGPVWWVLGVGIALLRYVAFAFAALPFAAFSVVSPPVFVLWIYYTILGGAGFAVRQFALHKVLFAPSPPAAHSADPLL